MVKAAVAVALLVLTAQFAAGEPVSSLWRIVALFGVSVVLLSALRVVSALNRLVWLSLFAVVGVGSYASALVALGLGQLGVLALAGAVVAGSAASLTIGSLSMRSADHYYAFVTLAASEIVSNMFRGLSLTGGANGLAGLPAAQLLGLDFARPDQYAWICLAGAVVSFAVVRVYERSDAGVALKAAGDEGLRVECLGIKESHLRVLSFAVGGALAGLGGFLAVAMDRFVGPESFGAERSIALLCLLVIGGGLATSRGIIVAAIFASVGLEALRPLGPWQMVAVSAAAFAALAANRT